jgi:hypothetical protein
MRPAVSYRIHGMARMFLRLDEQAREDFLTSFAG